MSDDEDHIHEMAVELAQHHRIDPMTSRDRCTCGYKAEIGKLFTAHIAKQLVAQGWGKR